MPRTKIKQAADIAVATTVDDAGLLHTVLSVLPQPVLVVAATAPHTVKWRNVSAQGQFRADVLPEGGIIPQLIETVVGQASAATIHDHDFYDLPCARIDLAALPERNACMITLTPQSALARKTHDDAQDALRSAGLMARMLAHELKNPLAGIQAAGQLLQKSSLDHAGQDLAALIVNESARICRLIDRVAIFDGDASDAMRDRGVPLNLHAPLEQALAVLAANHPHVAVTRRFDPSLPDIVGQHDQLMQVFDNLLRNAAEAGATQIDVATFYRHSDAPIDARHQQRLPITVQITDNGSGMNEQTRQRLFEPYYTTKAQGQGLGLPIVAKLVDDHGGKIDVSSVAGKTTFTLSFVYRKTAQFQEKTS